MSDAPSASDPLARGAPRIWAFREAKDETEFRFGTKLCGSLHDQTGARMSVIGTASAELIAQLLSLPAEVIDRIRAGGGLAAYVRDLEGARERAEGERDEARAMVSEWRSGLAGDWTGHLLRCAKVDGRWSCDKRCPSKRTERLEAALQRLAGHHHAVTHQGRFETCSTVICREAREALSPTP